MSISKYDSVTWTQNKKGHRTFTAAFILSLSDLTFRFRLADVFELDAEHNLVRTVAR